MRAALDGFQVLDLGTLTPGKYCTFLLAELGASVLRVERPVSRPRPISDEDLILNRGARPRQARCDESRRPSDSSSGSASM